MDPNPATQLLSCMLPRLVGVGPRRPQNSSAAVSPTRTRYPLYLSLSLLLFFSPLLREFDGHERLAAFQRGSHPPLLLKLLGCDLLLLANADMHYEIIFRGVAKALRINYGRQTILKTPAK
ncbi:hypothetical protein CPSG_09033 [Coccidioides posadasii str. Silveira]|uniref:Uncharacterized protein n=1 Tax=Coccidioides posadasii (strain RMSCC 757 / Silveira) TaxID=443226 RepID=E9DGT4_COCPS|nr:hypothetical protein CPSG_09033 [Coccidioides posadasii str. Silveira]